MNHVVAASRGVVWCPLCYEGRKGRRAYRGHYGFRAEPKKGLVCAMAIRRPPKAGASSNGSSGVATAGKILIGYPNVWEFLSLASWPDGASRKLGTIRVFLEGGKLKMALNDAEGDRYAFVSGDTLEDVLAAVDYGLDDDSLDWRQNKPGFNKARK